AGSAGAAGGSATGLGVPAGRVARRGVRPVVVAVFVVAAGAWSEPAPPVGSLSSISDGLQFCRPRARQRSHAGTYTYVAVAPRRGFPRRGTTEVCLPGDGTGPIRRERIGDLTGVGERPLRQPGHPRGN